MVKISLLLLLGSLSANAHWPQFRGPQASGVDSNAPLVTSWDVPSRQNVRWQQKIPGLGHASPIIWSNQLFVATAVGPGDAELKVGLYGDVMPVNETNVHQWKLFSLSTSDGKVQWEVTAHSGIPKVKRHPKASHCNSTPATDGKHLVAIMGSEGLFCFDLKGKPLWKKDLGPMDSGFFSMPAAQWGFASSPIIYQGRVIVQCDVQTNSFLAAFDVTNGNEIWRTPRQDVPSWGTPTVVEAAGRSQIVVNGWHHIGGYEFSSGKEIWKLDGGGDIPVPTPIFAHGLIYQTSAHGKLRPMRAIHPGATGDITGSETNLDKGPIAWEHPRQGNYMQTPIAVGNWIFGSNDGGVLTCFDAKKGTILYSERLGVRQGYTASPVSDGRHIYFPGETGKVLVVPVGEKFSMVATNDLGEVCMTVPAIDRGNLYFRTRGRVVALGAGR